MNEGTFRFTSTMEEAQKDHKAGKHFTFMDIMRV